MNDWKTWMDWGMLGTLGATLVGWLPAMAAGLTVAWYLVKFYDRFVKKQDSKSVDGKGE